MYISKLISDNRMFFFNFSSNEKKWHFVAKSVLTYSERKKFLWPRICKIFDITRTISSNSERSEQFLATACFFNLFLEVSQIEEIRTIRIQIGKN